MKYCLCLCRTTGGVVVINILHDSARFAKGWFRAQHTYNIKGAQSTTQTLKYCLYRAIRIIVNVRVYDWMNQKLRIVRICKIVCGVPFAAVFFFYIYCVSGFIPAQHHHTTISAGWRTQRVKHIKTLLFFPHDSCTMLVWFFQLVLMCEWVWCGAAKVLWMR